MSQESAPNSAPVQPETAGHEVAGERAGAERESRAVDGPNSAGDKRAKRAALRSKFDEYLKASSKEDMNERMEEALAKLKQEPGAEEFNLMCRSRNGNKAGLIILNRLHGSSSKKASVTAPAPMPEPEAEPEPKKVVLGKPKAEQTDSSAPAADAANVNTNNAVKAPLPGVITSIEVSVGDEVKAGDTVLVLEAMKMANNIEAEKDGKVTAILVQVGQSVMEDDNLVVIE